MAIKNTSNLTAALYSAPTNLILKSSASAATAGNLRSMWNGTGFPSPANVAATGSSSTGTAAGNVVLSAGNWAVCEGNLTTGSMPLLSQMTSADPTSKNYLILGPNGNTTNQSLLVFDRIAHGTLNTIVSGVSNTTFSNWTNTPFYSAGGIYPFIEFNGLWTAASSSSITMNYTSNTGQVRTGVSSAMLYGTSSNTVTQNFCPLELKNTDNVQDLGVASIQSANIIATGATAGGASIVLAKLVAAYATGTTPGHHPNFPNTSSGIDPYLIPFEEIRNNACLFFVTMSSISSIQNYMGETKIIQF